MQKNFKTPTPKFWIDFLKLFVKKSATKQIFKCVCGLKYSHENYEKKLVKSEHFNSKQENMCACFLVLYK